MLARFGFYSYLCSGNKVFHIQEWKRRRLRVSRVCNSERRITYKARSPALWAFCFCPKHGRTLTFSGECAGNPRSSFLLLYLVCEISARYIAGMGYYWRSDTPAGHKKISHGLNCFLFGVRCLRRSRAFFLFVPLLIAVPQWAGVS